MNFRVFFLLAVIAGFGALWSSDGRYQEHQVALARAARERTSTLVASDFPPSDCLAMNDAPQSALMTAAGSANELVAEGAVAEEMNVTDDTNGTWQSQGDPVKPAVVNVVRLSTTWVLGIDLGESLNPVVDRAALLRARIEERFCFLRFQTRQTGYSAIRRAASYLHAYAPAEPGRIARIQIRELSVEEAQGSTSGASQTR